MATDKELSDFLKSVDKRAFKRTVFAVRQDDAALDIVQDAMIRLAEKYADRPAAELPMLFQRILSNATASACNCMDVRIFYRSVSRKTTSGIVIDKLVVMIFQRI